MKRERDKSAGKKRVRMRASYANPPTDFRVAIDMSYDDLMDDKVRISDIRRHLQALLLAHSLETH